MKSSGLPDTSGMYGLLMQASLTL